MFIFDSIISENLKIAMVCRIFVFVIFFELDFKGGDNMTGGQIAGLIAAIAFLILVIWIGWFLTKVVKNLSDLSKNVNDLTQELDSVLTNTNELLSDVNDKAEMITPAVQAIADVGQSVSDVNEASRNFVEKINNRRSNRGTVSKVMTNMGRAAALGLFSRYQHHKQQKGDL